MPGAKQQMVSLLQHNVYTKLHIESPLAPRSNDSVNMIARCTDIVKFHSSIGCSLLRLKVYRVIFLALRTFFDGSRERRIICNIGRDTSSFRNIRAKMVAVCAGAIEHLSGVASFADEEELRGCPIFFGIEEI